MAGAPARRFGFWTTLGLTLVVVLAGVLASLSVAVGFALALLVGRPDVDPRVLGELLSGSGTLLSLTVVVSGALTVALVLLIANRREGITARDYLALRWPGARRMSLWTGATVLYLMAIQGLGVLAGVDFGDGQLLRTYCTTAWPSLAWLAFVVVAPVSEEVLFRGFFLGGISGSRMGVLGAVILASLLWALLHVQYDAATLVILVGAGLLFGAARVRTGSVVVPVVMHALWNAVAIGLVALEARAAACGAALP